MLLVYLKFDLKIKSWYDVFVKYFNIIIIISIQLYNNNKKYK